MKDERLHNVFRKLAYLELDMSSMAKLSKATLNLLDNKKKQKNQNLNTYLDKVNQFKRTVDEILDELNKCQDKLSNGLDLEAALIIETEYVYDQLMAVDDARRILDVLDGILDDLIERFSKKIYENVK